MRKSNTINQPDISVVCDMPTLTVSSDNARVDTLRGEGIVVKVIRGDETTQFAGIAENNVLTEAVGALTRVSEEMLINAVNNRTRERNYYKLYTRLLENEITDEEFDKEIDDNPDDYVVPIDKIPTEQEFYEAIRLSGKIKDVYTQGDMESLFSFKDTISYCKGLINGSI